VLDVPLNAPYAGTGPDASYKHRRFWRYIDCLSFNRMMEIGQIISDGWRPDCCRVSWSVSVFRV